MENTIFKQVGNNIQLLLEKRNLTQQFLADKLNVSKQVMSKIISGSKSINVAEISAIASVLDVSIDNLLQVGKPNEECHSFSFMGSISNPKTREKIELLKNAIDEILYMEDYANGR